MKFKKISWIGVACLILAGCSNPYAVHYDNLKLAFLLNEDAQLSVSEVQTSEVDLALIRSGDRPVAIIAKAYSEFGKEKWISKDRAMLVFDGHRIARTVGFKNDQLVLLSGEPDPLKKGDSRIDNVRWNWQVDWSAGEYGYPAESSFSTSDEQIDILGQHFSTLRIEEKVTYQQTSGLFNHDYTWSNYYWIDSESGLLLKTQQKHAPFADEFSIQFVSNAVKLMDNSKG